jgi:hypothetical protein
MSDVAMDDSAGPEVGVWAWDEKSRAWGPVSANRADRPNGWAPKSGAAATVLADRIRSSGRSAGRGM